MDCQPKKAQFLIGFIFCISLFFGNVWVPNSWGTTIPSDKANSFVTVNGMHFEIDGEPFYFVGANFWSAMNLASTGVGGDRARLGRELDFLAGQGVTVLRVMAGTEGPDSEVARVVPALQTAPGTYKTDLLDGLDYLISEMKQRDMYAVMCLTNFWNWSGGMSQYVNWATGAPLPIRQPLTGNSSAAFMDYTEVFYSNTAAQTAYLNHFDFIANRVNLITGVAYKDEPAIMTWEHANEPMGWHETAAFNVWIDEAAAHFKSVAPNHLVTVGTWGTSSWGTELTANHDGPHIDYTTIHLWPRNFSQFTPLDAAATYDGARDWALGKFDADALKSSSLTKPMVLEEFNLPRDLESYNPSSTTLYRDMFLTDMYAAVYASALSGGPAAGDQFWAWGGEGRPTDSTKWTYPGPVDWVSGDPWIGDPPHEPQGWYSVYDNDASTLAVISNHAAEMAALSSNSISQVVPLPVDATPIPCGGTKEVGFHFTWDPADEPVRAYSVRVKSLGGISFGEGDITVHVDDTLPAGELDYILKTYQVAGASGSDWNIDFAISGGLTYGIPSGIDLFSIVVHGDTEGLGTVSIEESRFRSIDGPPVTVDDNGIAEIDVDCSPPAAVSGINATTGSGNSVTVKWDSAGENLTYEIWRGKWYRYVAPDTFTVYPEYDDWGDAIWPTNPTSYSNAVSSEEWNLAGEVAPGNPLEFPDDNLGNGLERNLYFYEVFARDVAGNRSPASDATDYALSYLLGDVAEPWNGDVGVGDITALGDAYGTGNGDVTPPHVYNPHCDVGPTSDHSGSGIPDTDNQIEFEDLIIFAMNYDIDLSKIEYQPTGGSPIAILSWERVAENSWSLVLLDQCQDLKGLRLRAALPSGSVAALAAGDLLAGQEGPYFLKNIPAHGLDVGIALLGKSMRIVGTGELLRVTLDGDHDLGDLEIEVRSSRNELVEFNMTGTSGVTEIPPRFALSANYPNPFNPSTKIDFALPDAERVRLAIYGADGRKITTLVDGPMLAGNHTVTWTGRSDAGELVASGVYFIRIEAGTFDQTRKMTLLK